MSNIYKHVKALSSIIFLSIFIAALFFSFNTSGYSMDKKPAFTAIQKEISNTALKNGIPEISIKWAPVSDGNYTAVVSYRGISKKIEFTDAELEKAGFEKFSKETLEKINNTIAAFPGTIEPSPRKKQ